jgi:plastocyanin
MYWESWNYCEWEGDDWDGDTMWYCTDNANDGFDDWWYYCEEFEDTWYCTDDFGQSSDYEFSADNTHYKEGGRPDGGDGGGDDGDCPFSDDDFCNDFGPYCVSESPDYAPEYCGEVTAHYCLEDGSEDEGCVWLADACDAGEEAEDLCDAFLNFDHDAYHDGDDEDDHARLDGIIGTENPPDNIPVISSTNIVGALSDNEGLPMMYTGSFKLKFEGADASLETHEAYIPADDGTGTWYVEMILLEDYEVKSCEGCEDLVIEGSNAKFNTDQPVTVTFGKAQADTSDCDAIVTIGDDGYSFEPADITIAAGDTVCWMWKGTPDAHNVAEVATKFDADMNLEDAKIGFYSGEAANSVDFRQTFTEDDKTHYYVCEPHASMAMAGTVTVGNGTSDDPIQEIADESGLPSIGFVVGVLTLVGAAGLRRRIR